MPESGSIPCTGPTTTTATAATAHVTATAIAAMSSTLLTRHTNHATPIIAPSSASNPTACIQTGASHTGSVRNGASHTGAPVSPVEPVSSAAKVRPNGPCTTAIAAAACGSVNVANSTKKPAAPRTSLSEIRRRATSQSRLQPRPSAAIPMNRITKYAVSLDANINAVTAAAPNRYLRRLSSAYRQRKISSSTAHTTIRMSFRPNLLKYSSDGEKVRITAEQIAPLSPICRLRKYGSATSATPNNA